MQGEYEELQMLLSEKEAEDEVPEKMPFPIICKKIPFSPLTNEINYAIMSTGHTPNGISVFYRKEGERYVQS